MNPAPAIKVMWLLLWGVAVASRTYGTFTQMAENPERLRKLGFSDCRDDLLKVKLQDSYPKVIKCISDYTYTVYEKAPEGFTWGMAEYMYDQSQVSKNPEIVSYLAADLERGIFHRDSSQRDRTQWRKQRYYFSNMCESKDFTRYFKAIKEIWQQRKDYGRFTEMARSPKAFKDAGFSGNEFGHLHTVEERYPAMVFIMAENSYSRNYNHADRELAKGVARYVYDHSKVKDEMVMPYLIYDIETAIWCKDYTERTETVWHKRRWRIEEMTKEEDYTGYVQEVKDAIKDYGLFTEITKSPAGLKWMGISYKPPSECLIPEQCYAKLVSALAEQGKVTGKAPAGFATGMAQYMIDHSSVRCTKELIALVSTDLEASEGKWHEMREQILNMADKENYTDYIKSFVDEKSEAEFIVSETSQPRKPIVEVVPSSLVTSSVSSSLSCTMRYSILGPIYPPTICPRFQSRFCPRYQSRFRLGLLSTNYSSSSSASSDTSSGSSD